MLKEHPRSRLSFPSGFCNQYLFLQYLPERTWKLGEWRAMEDFDLWYCCWISMVSFQLPFGIAWWIIVWGSGITQVRILAMIFWTSKPYYPPERINSMHKQQIWKDFLVTVLFGLLKVLITLWTAQITWSSWVWWLLPSDQFLFHFRLGLSLTWWYAACNLSHFYLTQFKRTSLNAQVKHGSRYNTTCNSQYWSEG